MTALTIQHWAGTHDVADICGAHTITRFQDPSNNSDKYRRFIALHATGEPYMLITQTGRWTHLTANNDWSGGTYRFQKVAKGVQMTRHSDMLSFLREEVNRKIGGYTETHPGAPGAWISTHFVRQALDKAGLLNPSTPVPTSPVAPAPATPKPADNDLEGRIDYLVAQASDPAMDPFDLYADLAVIGASLKLRADAVAKEAAVVANLEQQITGARKLIMAREAG